MRGGLVNVKSAHPLSSGTFTYPSLLAVRESIEKEAWFGLDFEDWVGPGGMHSERSHRPAKDRDQE